ncbi:MAG: stage II sporulation protein M [Lachnospiraceae bacterium]|nr:stage II sporulation protein M [Lachnospiraceae bacterium]
MRERMRRQLVILFLGGFLTGVFWYLWGCDQKESGQILFVDTLLWRMSSYKINYSTYLVFLLRKRLFLWMSLSICAVTLVGAWIIRGFLIWSGFCFGSILTMYLYQYGGKGILYLLVLLFPQILFYIPAYTGESCLMLRAHRTLFFDQGCARGEKWQEMCGRNRRKLRWTGMYLTFFLVTIIGILMECYVNPILIQKLIKII